MKTQTKLTNRKTLVKKKTTIATKNSEIKPQSITSVELLLQPETKKETSEEKVALFKLTDKEVAVITSLSKGNSYKMIASDCNITINTVRQHIRNIHQKLKVHSSLEAVLLAMKKHLLFTVFSQSLILCDTIYTALLLDVW